MEVQAKGSLADCVSAKLTSYWRLMKEFVRGGPLCAASLPSLL